MGRFGSGFGDIGVLWEDGRSAKGGRVAKRRGRVARANVVEP